MTHNGAAAGDNESSLDLPGDVEQRRYVYQRGARCPDVDAAEIGPCLMSVTEKSDCRCFGDDLILEWCSEVDTGNVFR